MVFGPNFKRRKGVHIGRRYKNGHTYRRAQEQRAALAIAVSAEAGTVPAVNSIGGDTAVDERARVIPDEADLEDLAAPKRKRSDDNWRTARSVQSALKRESAALEKLARSQAQAKMIGHELYKSNKTHRQVVLQAEEEMGNLHERHREDIADLHERHREDVAAHHDLEECLADTKQELGATKEELQYSLSNRRIQGELHMHSLKRQSKNHHAALGRVQTTGQATIRELKSEHFLALRNQKKELTELNSQLSYARLQLDLTISEREYHIAVAVREAKRNERVHFNELLLAFKRQSHCCRAQSP